MPVTANAVLVRLTYYGDTNLDGLVSSDDFGNIDQAYQALHDQIAGNEPAITWFNGDFNYDGSIDGADYDLIDSAYQFQGSTPLFSASELAAFTGPAAGGSGIDPVAAVPEPTSAALLAAGGLLLGLRRRRK
jgi:hypothetical protein